jgi:hypothetical protein
LQPLEAAWQRRVEVEGFLVYHRDDLIASQ